MDLGQQSQVSEEEKEKQYITVANELDGKRYKMITRGDVAKLKVDKIKRYLVKATSIPLEEQVLLFAGQIMDTESVCAEYGLRSNDIIQLIDRATFMARSQPQQDDVGQEEEEEEEEAPVRGSDDLDTSLPNQSSLERLNLAETPQSSSQPQPFSPPGAMQQPPPRPSTRPPAIMEPSDPSGMSRQPIRPAPSDQDPTMRDYGAPSRPAFSENTHRPGSAKEPERHKGGAGYGLALHNLTEFGRDIGSSLALDDNLTCVVCVEDKFNVLITYDPPTERVYVYSTILASLPSDPAVKLRLYEALLEGALLGRQMAGGGVGVSVKNDLVLLSTSFDVTVASKDALRTIMPVFVSDVEKWRDVAAQILQNS